MRELSTDDLRQLLRECAGEDELADLDGDFADTPFTDLGYDSLAVIETASRLERAHNIRLSEDSVMDAGTPRALVALVNRSLAAVP